MRPVISLFASMLVSAAVLSPAWGQTSGPDPADPKRAPAEKMQPPESLSEKLSESEGVIRPPEGVDPDIKVPAPVPNPGTTKVIPPPGSPGNPDQSRPK
ncbi:MAG TPA: hypothetical protein VFV47_12445 [Hyphomicrobiaceae bacterium]|nr:hypothetical protein [Hyphomicrobiaceae bacterium]